MFRYFDKNNPYQQWKLIEKDGTITIVNKATGRCVDLAGGDTKEGAAIFSYDINGDEQTKMMSCITHDIGYTVGSGYKIHMKDIFTGEEMVQGDFPVVNVPGRDCRIFKCKLVK